MKLIERLIEIHDGTMARKAVWFNAFGLSFMVLTLAWVLLSPESFADLNLPLLMRMFSAYIFVLVADLLLSMIALRIGATGVWPATATCVTQGPCLFAVIYGMGTFTSPYFALFPIAVVMVALWFREFSGIATAIGGIVTLVALSWLESSGTIPHAPLVLQPGAQVSVGSAVARMLPVLVFCGYCFGMVLLVVAVRKQQDQRLRVAQKVIARYVPSQLAERILGGGHAEDRKHERRNLTIFFSDVAGFTDASDELDPEQLASLLNEYLGEMAQIADRFGATINQFVGDGIMIFFGAPQATNDRDHALRAVRMALDMQARMRELQEVWFKRGFERPFKIRIGLNTGYASVGDFGSQGRVMYSAIGLQTNLAARIQAKCEPGGILISHSTWALVNGDFTCNPQGEIEVKGVHYPVRVYDVTGPKVVALPVMAAAG